MLSVATVCRLQGSSRRSETATLAGKKATHSAASLQSLDIHEPTLDALLMRPVLQFLRYELMSIKNVF